MERRTCVIFNVFDRWKDHVINRILHSWSVNISTSKIPKLHNEFHNFILNDLECKILYISVIERTLFCQRNCYLQSSKGPNSKSVNTRVMVLALCTSSNVG